MKSHTNLLFAAIIGSVTVWSSIHAEQKAETTMRHPDIAIYWFHTLDPKSSFSTRRIVFADGKQGYTLTETNGKVIAKDVYYVKTFGGMAPTVEVHLLGDRFVVYPETMKNSDVPDARENAMHAVTHIYDLARGMVIESSEKYRYDHDIPLKYDYGHILRVARKASEAEQPGAAQPATQPADKPPVKDQPSTPTSKAAPR